MPEITKSQAVRALDVWVLGPLMIYAATKRQVPGWAKVALGVTGILTVLYNAHNYIANARLRELT